MLAYILAIIIALASLTLYLSAFFLPELHRKDDFLWSSVGLFYALVLWVCAGRIMGGVLLGQSAAVALVISFGWQTVKLRRALAHPDEKTDIEGFSLIAWLQTRLSGKKKIPVIKSKPQASVIESSQEAVIASPSEEVVPEIPTEEILNPGIEAASVVESITETVEAVTEIPEEAPEVIESLTALIEEKSPESAVEVSSTIIETATETLSSPEKSPKKGFSFKNLFGFGKAKPAPSPQKSSITAALDEIEATTKSEGIEEDWEDEGEMSEIVTLETAAIISEEVANPETETTSEEWEKEEEISETTTLETAAIISEEIANPEVVTTLEVTPKESDFSVEFEPFLGDDETETVIEDYQSIHKASSKQEALEVTETSEKAKIEESEIAAVEVITTESESVESSPEINSVSSPESIINEVVSQNTTESDDKTE